MNLFFAKLDALSSRLVCLLRALTHATLLVMVVACGDGGGGGIPPPDLQRFVPDLDSENPDPYRRLNAPYGMAVDSVGNVYVADTDNHIIRKITSGGGGEHSIFAGQPPSDVPGAKGLNFGTSDGIGQLARFHSPRGIAIDKADNIYVADTFNHTIRKINPRTREVTTLAGTAGSPGYADASSADPSRLNALFQHPGAIATYTDAAGKVTLYVMDTGNFAVRRITMKGDGTADEVSTPVGARLPGNVNDTGNAARFGVSSGGIATDSAGYIYVADMSNDAIRKINPTTWEVITLAGKMGVSGSNDSTDGTGASARFKFPIGIAVDSAGYIYVADTQNIAIRKISPGGEVRTLYNAQSIQRIAPPFINDHLPGPRGIAVFGGFIYGTLERGSLVVAAGSP